MYYINKRAVLCGKF